MLILIMTLILTKIAGNEREGHCRQLKTKQNIKVNGSPEQTFEMEEVSKSGLMVHYMRATGKTVKLMVKEG